MAVNITIVVNEEEIAELVVNQIANRMTKEYTEEMRGTKYGIREGVEKAVKAYIYSQKDAIVERCIARATAEIVRKGLPKLLGKLGELQDG